jgi:hypothetical protein
MHNEIGQELELSAEPRKLVPQLLDLLIEPEQITQERLAFHLSDKLPAVFDKQLDPETVLRHVKHVAVEENGADGAELRSFFNRIDR